MKFEPFSEDYVQRLTEGDSATGEHFASYFGRVIVLKLRVRLHSTDLIDDIKQETLMRVLDLLRTPGRVKRPERFPQFVLGVCDNVVHELSRKATRDEHLSGQESSEPIDPAIDWDASIASVDAKRIVRRVFAGLTDKERRVLKAMYLDETSKDEICRTFNTSSANLRTLTHRARKQFRILYRGEPNDGRGGGDHSGG